MIIRAARGWANRLIGPAAFVFLHVQGIPKASKKCRLIAEAIRVVQALLAGPQRNLAASGDSIDRAYRGRGVAKFALKAALESIRRQVGGIVEAYPVASRKMAAVPEWRWFVTPGMFALEGFRIVAPEGTSGVLMQRTISP